VLDLQEHVHDGLESRHDRAAGVEVLGAGEARAHAGEIPGGRVVGDAQIVKGRSNGSGEEAVERGSSSVSLG
jgi:hypothetical protein